MRAVSAAISSACLLALVLSTDVRAQVSSPRQMGQALSAQSPSGTTQQSLEDVGTLQGTERYLRRNRRPTDYVGPDLREPRRYVGALQARARGAAPASTEGLTRRVDRSESINRPLPPQQLGTAYYPRLELSLAADSPLSGTDLPAHRALDTLARSPHLSDSSRIAVSMEGRTAILQGEVLSATEAEIAEILLSFEPGVSEIRNELQVNPALRAGADSLATVRRQRSPAGTWTVLNDRSNPPPTRTRVSSTERSF